MSLQVLRKYGMKTITVCSKDGRIFHWDYLAGLTQATTENCTRPLICSTDSEVIAAIDMEIEKIDKSGIYTDEWIHNERIKKGYEFRANRLNDGEL